MLLNSDSLLVRPVKNSNLIRYSIPKTYTDANTDIAAYVTAGYYLYDMANTSSSPGLQGANATTSTAIVCLWKKAYPTGMYAFPSTWLSTSKDIVIMGCKVSTATTLVVGSSDYGLDVYWTQFGYSTAADGYIPATFMHQNAHFMRVDGNVFNFSGATYKNMTITNQYAATYNPTLFNNVAINSYQPMTLNYGANALYNISSINPISDTIGNSALVNIGTQTADMAIDGQNIFICSTAAISKLPTTTWTSASVVSIGTTAWGVGLCVDGGYLYCASPLSSSGNLSRVPINSFTSASISFINAGNFICNSAQKIICSDMQYIYFVSPSAGLSRIPTNNFTSAGITTLTLSSGAVTQFNTICNDGTNIYCAASNQNLIWKVPIATFTSASATLTTPNLLVSSNILTDNTNLYFVSSGTMLVKLPIATMVSSAATILTLPAAAAPIAIDGTYLYFGWANGWQRIPLSNFTTSAITYISNSIIPGGEATDGIYLYNNSNSNTNYNYSKTFIANQSVNSNVPLVLPSLNTGYLTGTTTSQFLYMNADINLQFQIFYSLLGKTTRNLYNIQFRNNAPIDDSLKKFNVGTNWLWRRTDAESYIAPSTNSTANNNYILNLSMYNSAGSAYNFTGLPEDENFTIRAVSSSGDEQIFEWYNDALRNTVFNQGGSAANTQLKYYITHCFSILEFEQYQDLKTITPNYVNGAISGSVTMNLLDNEILL